MNQQAQSPSSLLQHITAPADLQGLTRKQLHKLADEIRNALLVYAREHGGHIGSNLGVVELTIALHTVFNAPHDRIIFDVSHQSYVHKMLTGRAAAFTDPALFGSVTGFTNPEESDYDSFVLGHTGTSISLATGMARTRDQQNHYHAHSHHPEEQHTEEQYTTKEQYDNQHDDCTASTTQHIVAVIGDGALSSGVAFEGLNEAATQHSQLLIVINDNNMSISPNHGGMYRGLRKLRETHGAAPENIFTAIGLQYRYIEQGNSIDALLDVLEEIRDYDQPVVLHVHTTKGLGLSHELEGSVERNHWIDAEPKPCNTQQLQSHTASLHGTAKLLNGRKTYGQMAMEALATRFHAEPGLVVISPATPRSNGITEQWRMQAGTHYHDTGITEAHAVAYTAGIGRAGGTPVLATSATFFQRAYDQIQQEFTINHAPGTLLVFAAGLSGTDNTHLGTGDIAMLAHMPGLTCLAPTGTTQLLNMLDWATSVAQRPVVIRMPGEQTVAYEREFGLLPDLTAAVEQYARIHMQTLNTTQTTKTAHPAHPFDSYRIVHRGSRVAVLGLGNELATALRAQTIMRTQYGIDATVVDPQRYDTLDMHTLQQLAAEHELLCTIEDGWLQGGWGQMVAAASASRVLCCGATNEITDRVPEAELRARYGLTPEAIALRIARALNIEH